MGKRPEHLSRGDRENSSLGSDSSPVKEMVPMVPLLMLLNSLSFHFKGKIMLASLSEHSPQVSNSPNPYNSPPRGYDYVHSTDEETEARQDQGQAHKWKSWDEPPSSLASGFLLMATPEPLNLPL